MPLVSKYSNYDFPFGKDTSCKAGETEIKGPILLGFGF